MNMPLTGEAMPGLGFHPHPPCEAMHLEPGLASLKKCLVRGQHRVIWAWLPPIRV
jgi:hypothetical protein